MFGKLKKLFGNQEGDSPSSRSETPESSGTAGASVFLQREAVFDRRHRLAGHLFRISPQATTAGASASKLGAALDSMLLDTLNASPDAWNNSLAFIPLSSSSLQLAAVDRLKTSNIVLLVDLAPDADAEHLGKRLEELRDRGLKIGIYRQPKHPAFTQVIPLADIGAVDIGASEAGTVRDFSAAFRAGESHHPVQLFGSNIETLDDHRFCHQWHFDYFHGRFATSAPPRKEEAGGDPHKVLLLNLLRLVQSEAENAEIAEAMKQDPLLAFRILRYLNSPGLGLVHRIDSLSQALIILGRQRLMRWLSVLLFSVREPNFGDWLLVESALTRGRMMEVLGAQALPGHPSDPLFLTGIFSCLDRLLHRPMGEALADLPLAPEVRAALSERSGPYAALLAIAEAGEDFDLPRMQSTAEAAGLDPDAVNRALLAATAWASEVTEHWE